jgi:ABC-type transport system involved in cytochrome c biogenesis permease subunit
MVLMELSFVLLWAGIVMGAIWADHSWGRPWGWDPKEVFALNTFIVFAVLIHMRLKVKDKGLWTALARVIGCFVMLFNWIFGELPHRGPAQLRVDMATATRQKTIKP